MVIDDFNIGRAGCFGGPFEADPPLLIDTDAELTGPVAAQALQPVAGKGMQRLKAGRGVQNFQALGRLSLETLKRADERSLRESLGSFVAEAQDHGR